MKKSEHLARFDLAQLYQSLSVSHIRIVTAEYLRKRLRIKIVMEEFYGAPLADVLASLSPTGQFRHRAIRAREFHVQR